MNPLQTLITRFRELNVRQQIVLVGGLVAVLATLFIFFTLITRTSWVTVVSGIEPSQAPKVSEQLSSAGVQNKIVQGGTAIEVPQRQRDLAMATAATVSGSGSGKVGFEIFDKNNLGATDLQQQVQYQRALEGEVARVVENIDGVETAQVQLVLPKDSMFAEEGTQASASVLLTTAQPLGAAQVAGIAKLVQGAVPGLKSEVITITDQSGALLWPSQGGGSTSKAAAESLYGQQVSQKLQSLIVQSLGPGKSQVQVSADLNMDKTSLEKLQYGPKKGVPLSQNQQDENLNSNGGGGGGAAGTDANIPTYGSGGASGGTTRYTNKKNERNFGVDKTVTRTAVAPGAVNQLQVAVVLDSKVPAATAQALRQSLAAAAGIQPDRGDQLSVSQVPFAAPAEPKSPGPLQLYGGYARWALLALALLGFLFFVRRGLRRRETRQLDLQPTWLSDLEKNMAAPRPQVVQVPTRNKSSVQQQVEKMVEEDPEQIAAQVREWLNND